MLAFLGWTLIVSGLFFIISGAIAIFRLSGFYTKLHAASVIECCGIPLCLIGLTFLQNDIASSFKLLVMAFLIFILNPVSTFALSRASILFKIDQEGRIK